MTDTFEDMSEEAVNAIACEITDIYTLDIVRRVGEKLLWYAELCK